jgi:hypothetical protein
MNSKFLAAGLAVAVIASGGLLTSTAIGTAQASTSTPRPRLKKIAFFADQPMPVGKQVPSTTLPETAQRELKGPLRLCEGMLD